MCQSISNLVLKVTEELCDEQEFKVSSQSLKHSALTYPCTHTCFVSISLPQFTCFHGCAYTAGIFGVFVKVKLAQLLNES